MHDAVLMRSSGVPGICQWAGEGQTRDRWDGLLRSVGALLTLRVM